MVTHFRRLPNLRPGLPVLQTVLVPSLPFYPAPSVPFPNRLPFTFTHYLISQSDFLLNAKNLSAEGDNLKGDKTEGEDLNPSQDQQEGET